MSDNHRTGALAVSLSQEQQTDDLWPVVTIPLSPYIQPDRDEPIPTKRMRPVDALDLPNLITELEASKVTTVYAEGHPWSVESVFSPYSADVHVMLIENSNRYLPGPEVVPDAEGDALMQAWQETIQYISARSQNAQICAGYNWSPRSWGTEEEKTGFQSLPTKWHPMLWGWPAFPAPGQSNKHVSWKSTEKLSPSVRRLFGFNDYATPLSEIILDRIRWALAASESFGAVFNLHQAKADSRGVCLPYEGPLAELLGIEGFFSRVLKPIASILNNLFVDLSESFTTLDCDELDQLLATIEKTPPTEDLVQALRKDPEIRTKDEIQVELAKRNLSPELVDVLFEPIRRRCAREGEPQHWWRKGFGYALVFSDQVAGDRHFGELRILPGVYVGPAGVVEVQGVVLERPENQAILPDEVRIKSCVLHQLGALLQS